MPRMSLQVKFAVLIGLLFLTVVVSMGAAIFAVTFLQRETASALDGASEIFSGLASVRDRLDSIDRDLARHSADLEQSEEFTNLLDQRELLAEETARLAESPQFQTGSFVTARVNLLHRLNAVVEDMHAQAVNDHAPPEVLISRIESAIALISMLERRVLQDTNLAVARNAEIQSRLLLMIVFALLSAGLIGLLALVLLRRWVVSPVAQLRQAAARIGSGDFAYRLAITGNDEIAELGREVNHMSQMISTMQEERIERERLAAIGEMVRRIAHNLRNPLAGIRSLAELTQSDLPPDSALHANQQRIVSAVDRFEHWLADLLDATSPLALNLSERKVRPWLDGLVSAYRPMAIARGIELELRHDQGPERAVFDDRHLEHAVVAILSNAIEASNRGSSVELDCQRSEDGQRWQISITDEAGGVAPDLLPEIFKANFTTKRDGNGIGLAVAHRVVKAHGGSITVSNQQIPQCNGRPAAAGAIFTLDLPIVPSGDRQTSLSTRGEW